MAFVKVAKGDSFLDRTINFEYMFSPGGGKLLYSKHHGYQANCDKEIRVLDWQKTTYMSGFNKTREQFRIKSTKLLKRREELKRDDQFSQVALRCHSAPPSMMTSHQSDVSYTHGSIPVSIFVVEIMKTSNECKIRTFSLGLNSCNPYAFFSNFIGGEPQRSNSSTKPLYALVFDTNKHMYGKEAKDLIKFRNHFKKEMKISPASLSRQIEEEINNSQQQVPEYSTQHMKREIMEVEQSSQLHSMVSHYVQMTDTKRKCLTRNATNRQKVARAQSAKEVESKPLSSPTQPSEASMQVDMGRTSVQSAEQRHSRAKALIASASRRLPVTTPMVDVSSKVNHIQGCDNSNLDINNNNDSVANSTKPGQKLPRRRQRVSFTTTKSAEGVRRIVHFAQPEVISADDKQNRDAMNQQNDVLNVCNNKINTTRKRSQRSPIKVITCTPTVFNDKATHQPKSRPMDNNKDRLRNAFDEFTKDVNVGAMRKLVSMASNLKINTKASDIVRKLSIESNR